MTPGFIALHDGKNQIIYISVKHLQAYKTDTDDDTTVIFIIDWPEMIEVKETPEQIGALLFQERFGKSFAEREQFGLTK